MAAIEGVYAREILDSRGVPTIECTLWMDNGGIVATSVPTGTSVGKYEALELRDNDPTHMLGKGVSKAVSNVNTIIGPAIIGMDPTQQSEIDKKIIELDGTDNKSKLGANATLAVSQAVLKAGALSSNLPLYYYTQQSFQLVSELSIPSCIYTVINGGQHGADNLDLQEYQIVPASHISFPDSINMAVTLFQKLEEILIMKGAIHSVGLVGGFTPNLYSNTDVFEILVETIKSSPYTFAQDLFFGIDVAASHLQSAGKYTLKDRSQGYTTKEFFEYFKKMRDLYNVFYIEDPFQEDDLDGWKLITADLGETTKIVGDSLLVTNKKKVQEAVKNNYCNTLLVKPNQVGTITETIDVIRFARESGWQVVMSHRSGETNDDLISDLAVGVGAEYAKFGPTNRGERIAKYNRFMQIFLELQQAQQGAPQPAQSKKGEDSMSTPQDTPQAASPTAQTPAPAVMPPEPAPSPEPQAPAETTPAVPETPVATPSATPQEPVVAVETPVVTPTPAAAPAATEPDPITTPEAAPAADASPAAPATPPASTTPPAPKATATEPPPMTLTATGDLIQPPQTPPTTPTATPHATTTPDSTEFPPVADSEASPTPVNLSESEESTDSKMPNPAVTPGAVQPAKPDAPAVPADLVNPTPTADASTAAAMKPSAKMPDSK